MGNKQASQMLHNLNVGNSSNITRSHKYRNKPKGSKMSLSHIKTGNDTKCKHMNCLCQRYAKDQSKWSKGRCKDCNHSELEHRGIGDSESDSDSDSDGDEKNNDGGNNHESYSKDFTNWFKQIQVSQMEFKQNNVGVANDEYPNKSVGESGVGESGVDDDAITEEAEEKLIQVIIDMLGVDHILLSDKIDENYLCALGNSDNMTDENINKIIQSLSDNIPSVQLQELLDDDEDNDEKKGNDDADFRNIPKKMVQKIAKGCMVNDHYLRTLIDAIKCRVGLQPFIQFDLGAEEDIQLTLSDLIALLLELCNINTHKKLLIPIIEQQIPIPISYVMASINYAMSSINEEQVCEINYYCRDIAYLASQSKVLCDGMSQTEILRDRPLVMFVGSSKTEGKSSLLMNLYEKQKFNMLENKNVIHNTSIDLVYLPERHEANYHIIDVHGTINDPLFYKSTNNKITRMNLLTYVASLCHVIVFEINESELDKSMKNTKESNMSIDQIFGSKCLANDVMDLYNNIKNYNNKNKQYLLIIRDLKNIKKGPNGPNIFKCPPPKKRKGQDALRIALRKKLDEYTKDIKLMSPLDLKWWQEIDVSHNIDNNGLLPLSAKRIFSNMDINDKRLLVQFRNDLSHAIHSILINDKDKELPFINLYDEFSQEFKKPIDKIDEKKLRGMIVKAAQLPLSKTLKLFWTYCLPNFMNTSDEYDKKQKNKNLWLRSEFMYILDDIVSTRNRKVLSEPRQKMKQLQAKKSEQLNGADEKALRELARIEKECQIGAYDFFKSVQSICNFTYQYKSMLESRWSKLSYKTKQNIKLLQEAVMQFNHELFCSGVPIEFCDGDYIRMNEDFVNYIFQQKGSTSDKTVACIAVAGPQSTGKSTLLRRLFGIEARASAGRTTKGINCCGINGETVDVLLVDTEGIGSPEMMSNGKNSKSKEKKRDNKIVLSALASARVFILNIMRDAKDTRMLDVILWAYEKLNPHQQNNNANYKKLNDIKFVFVIRDVEEYTDPKWLDSQINGINQHLKESLLKSPSYTNSLQDDEKMANITIQDIIGEPLYFPMPSAFERGSPNPEFAKKCIELRSIIFKYLQNTNKNNSYSNRIQWSNEMCKIWDRIVQFEDVLSPADFRTQADHQHMQKQVNMYLQKLRNHLKGSLAKLENELLMIESHEVRCSQFNHQFRVQYKKELNKLSQEMKLSPQNKHCNEQIREQYVQEFKDRSVPYLTEQTDLFSSKSNRKRVLNVENQITDILNKLKNELRTKRITDIKLMQEQYNKVFTDKMTEFDTYIKKQEKEPVTIKFFKAYENHILLPNQIAGRVPSSENQFDINFKKINTNKLASIEKTWWGTGKSYVQNVKFPKPYALSSNIQSHCKKFVADINTENFTNMDFLMGLIRLLDRELDQIDTKNKTEWRLSEDFRAASHTYLRENIMRKLTETELQQNDKIRGAIKELQFVKWKKFQNDISNISTSQQKAKDFLTDTLQKEITLFSTDTIEAYANDYFSQWTESLSAKRILLLAFRDAFGTHQTGPDQALRYILNQQKIIKEEFEKSFANKKTEFINSECRTSLKTEIEDGVNKWIKFFKEWKKDIDTKKFEVNIPNTTILQQQLEKICNIEFKTRCDESEISDADIFVATILDTIYELKELSKKRFLSLVDECIKQKKETLKISSFGCVSFCPCCGAKCELDAKHSANHETKFHVLQAFGGTHEMKSKRLVVDVCSSKSNQTATWNKESLVWPEFIKQKYPKWDPIDDKQNFDKDNVLLMVRMYFDLGLQDAMLSHSSGRWKDYQPTTRDRVGCKDEIGWNVEHDD